MRLLLGGLNLAFELLNAFLGMPQALLLDDHRLRQKVEGRGNTTDFALNQPIRVLIELLQARAA
jgi:hypothetical protein